MRKGSQSPPSDRAPRSRQAPRQGRPPLQRLAAGWVEQHREGARSSLGRLRQTPWSSLMTLLVIGLALALPGALYVLTHNLERLGEGWDQTAAISLFLKIQVDGDQAEALAGRLAKWPDLEGVTLIPPEQALEELRAETGFAEAVEQLETNPLPYVLSLRPAKTLADAASLEGLRDSLAALPEADLVRMDTLWVRRFQSMVALGQRAALVLGSGLALGVLLVIGNTIRLEIENRRQEIVIMETVGATHAFIRRPFLWVGIWYGLLGGLVAWLLIFLARLLMQGPVSRLAALYQTEFPLVGLSAIPLGILVGGSLLLGLVGSWLAVTRHLAAIQPS